MNILITGSNGQLGSVFRQLAPEYRNYRFLFTGKQELDVTSAEQVMDFIKRETPDVLINCSGYTDVDQAENNVQHAQALNARACGILAGACSSAGTLMVHISSDYVFDGKSCRPYTENDTAAPGTVYGKSKLDGELEVLFNARRSVIIRTSWLYSSVGRNFVMAILAKAKTEKQVRVVFDQVGSPTYAPDLARAVLTMIPQLPSRVRGEIYHYSNAGVCSWYDVAHAIMEITGVRCTVVPVTSKEYKAIAARPHYSVLDTSRIKRDFGLKIPYWRDSLKNCLAESGTS